MKIAVGKRFPLKEAYPFAEAQGLGDEVAYIKGMHVNWHGKYTYNSTVRRGYIIDLLKRRGLLDDFFSQKWRRGLTQAGRSECESCLRVMREYEELLGQS